jgi:K+-sensing histidine kinase KdpD
MTGRTRIAITLAAALALAVAHYGQAMHVADPGSARDLWDYGVVAAYVVAIVGVALVDRWWALLPAFVPGAVTFYLYNFTSYSTPWDSESVGDLNEPIAYAVLLLLAAGIQVAVLSIGFLPRRVWDVGRRLRMPRTTPKETDR